MNNLPPPSMRRSRLGSRRVWIATAGALLAVGIAVYFLKGQDIVFYASLFNAKLVADRFYAEYPGLARNIPYGPLPGEKLDVYQPQPPGKHPVVIFVHGGGWRDYTKELHAPVAQRLVPNDLVAVLPEYTLTAGTTYRQQTAEIAAVIAWTLENIDRYGGDPTRVIVGGQSAGAHLTALAVLDKQWLAAVHHTSDELAGLYGVSGVYDINAQMAFERQNGGAGPVLIEEFEGEANFVNGSPSNFVRPDLPPILLIHGDADTTVPLGISKDFQARLQAVGARSKLLIYPGAGHAGLLFDALASNPARLVTDLVDFATSCPPARSIPQ
ncbi:MAG: alpha/beta hydrolase [Anaerolineae bacterium]